MQDGDDLLHVEDMIDIFKRLWRLAGNMSENHLRKKVLPIIHLLK